MGSSLTVPYPFDVVIDGQGYVLYDGEASKSAFGLTPVFVPRTNTQGDYGDNQQDFWLTWTQKDWSKGMWQRYQGRDDDGEARFYFSALIDTTMPGEVTIRRDKTSFSAAAAVLTAVGDNINDRIYFATSTNLYYVIYDGTVTTTIGAHGLGAAPDRFGAAYDGRHIYLTTTTAGTVGVRRWNGATFATFSGTGANAIAYHNNSLYGYRTDNADLVRYDSAGTATTIATWRDASGDATGYSSGGKLVSYGGKLLILRYRNSSGRGPELWIWDGSGVSKIAEFPSTFNAYDCEVLNGAIFVGGVFEKHVSSATHHRPAIYVYKDGVQDILWQSEFYEASTNVTLPALATYLTGLVWYDTTLGSNLAFYDPSTGSISGIATSLSLTANPILASAQTFFVATATGTSGGYIHPASATASVGTIYHSLVDFDTSLRKVFRGIRAEFESATDGDGGSVDIKYRYDNIDSGLTYTTLQTSAASGVEYLITAPPEGTTHHSISVLVQMNKGTSTDGPKLKRVQVRAVPVQPAFKKRQYALHLGGRDGKGHVRLRDGSLHALDGLQMATNLQTAASRTSPIAIYDHLSAAAGFTGVIENLEMREYKPEEFVAVVTARSV